jgi:transposase-like protein
MSVPVGHYHKTTPEARRDIVERYIRGESIRDIARKYDIDRTYVWHLARRAGYVRKRGEKAYRKDDNAVES